MEIITLLQDLVKGLLEAEEKFLSNPKDFYALEKATKTTTDAMAAQFLSGVLSCIDKQIYDCRYREGKYTVQRTDTRNLVSSVGDLTFDCTYYRKAEGGYVYLLEELLGLDKDERFTEEAEVILLTEALKTSYAEAARSLPSKSTITKTTVMNKVHGIAKEMPITPPIEKKECTCLFIEADEDHIAEQHGNQKKESGNKSFISRLAYVYEYKQENPKCKGRKELVNTFYFSGVYAGSEGIEKFWKNMTDYIDQTYDSEKIKHIYISGDGAPWIKSGAKYIRKALFCADKFHLMKYINAASGQMMDEKEIAKAELWHLLYKKDRDAFKEYTNRMAASAGNTKPIEDLQSYVQSNWQPIMRSIHNKIIDGCSAEGHVSHVLSNRLSSRPMGWSQTGADRMSKLRCFERNYGRERIIDLVKYSRKQRRLKRTGTDNEFIEKVTLRQIKADHYDQAKSYIERIQATMPGLTARKKASIRTQLRLM